MVAVNVPEVYIEEVLTISVHVVNGLTDDCHFVIVPVWPDKVNTALVLPEHIVDPPVTVPPTEAGETVIVPVAFILPHPPVNGML